MTAITATELKTNMGKYLKLAAREEIGITKNGKLIAKLVPARERVTDSLIGVMNSGALPEGFDGDYRSLLHEMRLEDYENND